MARVVTLDSAQLLEVRLVRDPNKPQGEVRVFAWFNLGSAGKMVQSHHKEVTATLSPTRKAAVEDLFSAMIGDVSAEELS